MVDIETSQAASTIREEASAHLINIMTRMPDVLNRQRIWIRGEGSCVYDELGREFLDASAGAWYANVGYGWDEIADAVAAQMRELPHYALLGDNVTGPPARLAARLAGLTPGDVNRFLFTSGGSEAVESAIKIARMHFALVGESNRYKIISRWGGYHGATLGAMSATGTTYHRRKFEPVAPGFVHVSPLSVEALEEAIILESPETIAAFIAEPIMAGGGVLIPPDDYFQRVRELCDRHGIFFISDEVVCGFGRLGYWFGVQHWDVVPDMLVMAKGMASGYVPMGAVGVSEEVFAPFLAEDGDNAFYHGYTASGHAACCAGALACLDIIERERLLERSAQEGLYLHQTLSSLIDGEVVVEVRGGVGLMAGLQFAPPIAKAVSQRAYEHGVLVRPMTPHTITPSPPLIIKRDEIDRLCEVLRLATSEVLAEEPNVFDHYAEPSGGFASSAAPVFGGRP
jgi:putrescine aminotransferase